MTTSAMFRWCAVVATCVLCNAPFANATIAVTYPVQVDPADMARIAVLACAGSGGKVESARSLSYLPMPKPISQLDVTCRPNGKHNGLPIKSTSYCSNSGGQWHCEPAYRWVVLRSAFKSTLVQADPPEDLDTRLQIVQYLLHITNYMGQNVRDMVEGERCTMHLGPTKEWVATCGGAILNVALDCNAGRCSPRLFGGPVSIAIP